MVVLLEQEMRMENRQSSKGNQMKWMKDGNWYKADYTGYEGLAEYMISALLTYSSLEVYEYVNYETEQINCGYQIYRGCRSKNFKQDDWQLITLERLFQNTYNVGLYKSLYSISDHENRMRFLVEQTEQITGLHDFGIYISKLLTLDTFFLNEDRHTHNMAVLMDGKGNFRYCPVFDNGGALLSDTTMDYPMKIDTSELMHQVKPAVCFSDFDEQLDIAEKLYGQHICFNFGRDEILELLDRETYYPEDVKNRVAYIIQEQRRKYAYLFR